MATGKTVSIYTRFFLDDADGTPRNLSASVATIGGIGVTNEQVDVTGLSNLLRQFLSGHGDMTLEISGPVDNTADVGSHTVLAPAASDNIARTMTVQIGIRAEPASGDPEFEGEVVVTRYIVDINNGATYNATLKPAYGAASPAWGTVSA